MLLSGFSERRLDGLRQQGMYKRLRTEQATLRQFITIVYNYPTWTYHVPVVLSERMNRLLRDLQLFGAQLGFDVSLESGERTCDDQKRIYRDLGKPLVNCSYHLSGDAIDIRVIRQPLSQVAIDVPGFLSRAGGLAKNSGFRWGGDFRDRDPFHFDDGLRAGRARCCNATPGRGALPGNSTREGIQKARRRRGALQEARCDCCGRVHRPKRNRRTRRDRCYEIEPYGD